MRSLIDELVIINSFSKLRRSPFQFLFIISSFVLVFGSAWPSQADAQSRRPSTVWGPVTLGGTVGFSTEAYSASGINARRPNGSGRLFGKTSASIKDVRYGLDFLLSTEDDRLRQSLNRVAASVAYNNWDATVGDFSPRLNKYGLNGATVRGASLSYAPGDLYFSFMAGRSRRAVDTGVGALIRRPAFDRNLFSASVGVGPKTANHFHLQGLIARDKETSLSTETAAQPAENVSFTPSFGLFLLENSLEIRGELTGSAFTRDVRAAETSGDLTPSFFGLFTPRVGSRFDYASDFSARYSIQDFSASVSETLDQLTILTSYSRVAPGFTSLGRPYTRSDQAVFRFQPQARLLNNKMQVALDVTSRRNNLDNNRTATLKRNQIGLSTQAQLSDEFFLNASFIRLANNNNPLSSDPVFAPLEQRLLSRSLMLAPVLTRAINGLTHRFSLTTTFQSLSDKTERSDNAPRPTIDFNNTSTTLGHHVILASGLALNSSLSLVNSKAPSTDVKAVGVVAGGSYGFFNRKLNVNLTGGLSRTTLTFQRLLEAEAAMQETEKSTQLTFSLTGTYRVTLRDVIRLSVRGLSTNQPLRGNFQEIQSTLRFEHRF
ncbi:MAG: hypothetical protein AAF564_10465 [Bacteroidota bacterium]